MIQLEAAPKDLSKYDIIHSAAFRSITGLFLLKQDDLHRLKEFTAHHINLLENLPRIFLYVVTFFSISSRVSRHERMGIQSLEMGGKQPLNSFHATFCPISILFSECSGWCRSSEITFLSPHKAPLGNRFANLMVFF